MLNEMNYTNDFTMDMQTVLNNHLKGPRFVYRTKYGGETFGVIAEVGVGKAIIWDRDTQANFTNALNNAKIRSRTRKSEPIPPIPVRNYYSAYTVTITIKSTNNISYSLMEDNIYILND